MSVIWFRIVAFIEAVSFLLLLVATAAKHFLDRPEGVSVLGPIHGTLFVAYVGLLYFVKQELKWNWTRTVVAFIGASIPFGGFVVERRLLPPVEVETV